MPNRYGQRRNLGEVISDALNFAGDRFIENDSRRKREKRQTGLDAERVSDKNVAQMFRQFQVANQQSQQKFRNDRAIKQDAQRVSDSNVDQMFKQFQIAQGSKRDRATETHRADLLQIAKDREDRLGTPKATGGGGLPAGTQTALSKHLIENRAITTPGSIVNGVVTEGTTVQPPGFTEYIRDTLPAILRGEVLPQRQDPGNPARVSRAVGPGTSSPIDFQIGPPRTGLGNTLRNNAISNTGGQFDQSIISRADEAYGVANIPGWDQMTTVDQKLDALTKDRTGIQFSPSADTSGVSGLSDEEIMRQLGLGGGA